MRIMVMLAAVGMLMAGFATAEEAPLSPREFVAEFYETVFNRQDVAAIDRFLIADFVDHNPDPGQAPGIAGVKAFFTVLIAAFPDVRATVEDVLVDGNKVTVRSTLSGTQSGPFMGIPPAQRRFSVTLIDIIEIKDGKATQRWGLVDAPTMMQQLSPEAPNP